MTSYVSPVAFTTVAQSIPPNVFADMDRKVAAAVAGGADVIDLAKGNPDAFPADFIREVAKKAVDDPGNARYSPFDGKPSFLRAAESWYRNTYGVEVDWKTQLFAVEGAVDGLGKGGEVGRVHRNSLNFEAYFRLSGRRKVDFINQQNALEQLPGKMKPLSGRYCRTGEVVIP